MFSYSCLNYSQLYRHYPQHFETVLIYSPRPLNQKSNQLKTAMQAAILSAKAKSLWFSPAFNAMNMAQIEILTNGEFGDLSIHTAKAKARKGVLSMQLDVGAIYKEYLQPNDAELVQLWCKDVASDILRLYGCNRSSKQPIILKNLRT